MYDVYGRIGDEWQRIVVPAGHPLPKIIEAKDWRLLGKPTSAKPDIDDDIQRQGFSKYRASTKFDERHQIGAATK